jgi:ATP-dependent helicase/nuclease subunit A
MTPTPQQQKIIASRGLDICVNASAGTGKTTVLVDRMISLIRDDQVPVSRILAITFTEKAAQELKAKLSGAMREHGLDYRAAESAYISTFHAFCGRILRENCFRLKLPPDFGILTDIPGSLLLEEAINTVLERRLKADDIEIGGFLEKYPRATLTENIAAILEAVTAAGQTPRELQAGEAHIQASVYEFNNAYLKQVYAAIQKQADRLRVLSTGSARIAEVKAQLVQICAREFARERFLEIQALLDGVSIPQKNADAVCAGLQELRGLVHKDLKRYKGSYSPFFNYSPDIENRFARLSGEFLTLLEEVRQEYAARKKRNNRLDFEDLQLQTLAMLNEKKDIARFYQDYFYTVMVDEFQDTNGLQDKIIRRLAGPRKLFIVGDWKQAIYRFRHADNKIFDEHHQDIQRRQGLVVPLTKNFRCARNIIDAANLLCAPLFAHDNFDYPPGALEPGLETQNSEPGLARIVFLAEADSAEQARAKEARYIAGQLRQLAGQDNAILLPKTTACGIYTSALEAEGLAYTLWNSGAYYTRGEIIDTLNFLRLLNNPRDDFKLAAVLRSEMFSVSDEALFLLSRNKGDNSLFSVLAQNQTALSAADRDKIARFLAVYSKLSACVGKLPVARLLQLVISGTLFARIALTYQDKSAQVSANLHKLLEIAKNPEFEQRDLNYFVSYIEKLQARGDKETDAEINEARGTVKILSIHKAKGLEFDNVFLADIFQYTGDKVNNNPFHKTLAAAGIPLALRYKEDDTEYNSLAYLHGKRLNAKAEAEEKKRLFYVAVTRARKQLQIISTYPVKLDKAGNKFEPALDRSCLDTQNSGAWLRYLYQQHQIPAELISADPEIPPASDRPPRQPLPTALPEAAPHYLPELPATYELHALPATLAGELLADRQSFIADYFYAFPQPAPRTYSQFDAEAMQRIGLAAHKAIELKARTAASPLLTPEQNKYLQKCLDNFYASPLPELMAGNRSFLELDMEYTVHHVRYHGRADLVIQTPDKILIYDFKTGQYTAAEQQKYCAQVSVYAAILQAHFPALPIEGHIFYLYAVQGDLTIQLDTGIFAHCAAALNDLNPETCG